MRKPIPGFPGYEVDDEGNVYSTLSGKLKRLRPGRQVSGGYKFVGMCCHGRKWYRRVHRLVLEAFVGPCPPGMQACHNDGDHDNNRLSNLRWDTPQANQDDVRRHGRRNSGERNGNALLTAETVRAMREDYAAGMTRPELAVKYGTAAGNVWLVVTRRSWTHV